MDALRSAFDDELERSLHRIREAIAPYTRFVRAERDKLTEQRDTLSDLGDHLADLRGRIERLE